MGYLMAVGNGANKEERMALKKKDLHIGDPVRCIKWVYEGVFGTIAVIDGEGTDERDVIVRLDKTCKEGWARESLGSGTYLCLRLKNLELISKDKS